MKSKDLKELKAKSLKELKGKLKDLKKERVEKLMEQKLGKTKNVHEVLSIRKSIARVMTLIKLKELSQKPEQEANAAG